MAFDYEKYLRPGKLPHIWCPGCGHGIVMKGLIRVPDDFDRMGKAEIERLFGGDA